MSIVAKRRIEQSPLTDAPAVPKGTIGQVDDIDLCEGLLVVDFGEPFGHVLCEPGEVGGN